jgi:HlyD family secretion protein
MGTNLPMETINSMTIKNLYYTNTVAFAGKGNVIFYLLLLLLSVSCNKGKTDDFTVLSGSFRQSVIEAGELQAINASSIIMPPIGYQYGYQFKIIGLADHGKTVHKGDSVIKLDPSSVYKFILDTEDKLENELAAAKKQAVQSENNIQDLNAQLKTEQAAYDLKKLAVERLNFESDIKKKIADLEFQQATIRLNKVRKNLELKPKLDDFDRRIQRIRVTQRETDVRNAKETLKKFLIRAPLDGIFQVAPRYSWDPGSPIYKMGDSPYMGSMLASIPDVKKMKAISFINEADISKVRIGMKVLVRLDALPSVPFNGVITSISKICSAHNDEKVFNTVVEILESDVRLKPGMTVNCEYIFFETEKGMYVPNNCLLNDKGHSYLFLKRGRSSRKVEVKPGPANSNHTIIAGEVKPGQRLIPFENVLANTNK